MKGFCDAESKKQGVAGVRGWLLCLRNWGQNQFSRFNRYVVSDRGGDRGSQEKFGGGYV